MRTVHKFPVQMLETFAVQAPQGAEFLSVQVQGNEVQLWTRVDTTRPLVMYRFGVCGTGHPLSDFNANAPHIGTFQINAASPLVFHLFGGLYE